MKNIKEFIDTMVKIEYIESSNCIGHYPFQLFAETENGEFELNSLLLGGDVNACYSRFIEYQRNNAKRIYMSLDFPSGMDISHDFVCIFQFENNELVISAIPYNNDGDIFEIITESEMLFRIKSDYERKADRNN